MSTDASFEPKAGFSFPQNCIHFSPKLCGEIQNKRPGFMAAWLRLVLLISWLSCVGREQCGLFVHGQFPQDY